VPKSVDSSGFGRPKTQQRCGRIGRLAATASLQRISYRVDVDAGGFVCRSGRGGTRDDLRHAEGLSAVRVAGLSVDSRLWLTRDIVRHAEAVRATADARAAPSARSAVRRSFLRFAAMPELIAVPRGAAWTSRAALRRRCSPTASAGWCGTPSILRCRHSSGCRPARSSELWCTSFGVPKVVLHGCRRDQEGTTFGTPKVGCRHAFQLDMLNACTGE
jgi:hypothetical protein